jgi:predicted dehydrogenase
VDTPTSSSPVRLALVGAGGHGHAIQDAIEDTEIVDLRAVYDVDETAMREAAERFEGDPAASYEALLRRDDLEAVVLATPNALHRSQAEAAFQAGLHVLVEKPIANTVADGRAMIEAAETADRLLMVGHDMRRSRGPRKTRRVLEKGGLGEVISMEIHFSMDTVQHLPPDSWRLQPDQCPLLPIMQLGIHGIDLVHYFFGPITEVFAFTRSAAAPPGVVDSVAATFRTENGLQGTLISNYCTQPTFEYRITGTEATLRSNAHKLWFQTGENTTKHGGGPAELEDFSAHSHESYARQMEAFGRAIREGTDPETDGWVALQALAVVEALRRSAETSARQTVPDVRSPQAA